MNEWMNEWMTLFKSEKSTKWFFILHSVYRLKLLQYYYLSKVTIILVKLLGYLVPIYQPRPRPSSFIYIF
jgi:hypothetical protein